jgi:ketosteroid isomerase-like protein
MGSLGSERVEVHFDEVEKQGNDTFGYLSAIGRYTAIDASGTPMRSMHNRLSWVLKRSDSGWLIVHEHASVPISFSDTKGILQRD